MFEGQPKGLYALALANTGERFGYLHHARNFCTFLKKQTLVYRQVWQVRSTPHSLL